MRRGERWGSCGEWGDGLGFGGGEAIYARGDWAGFDQLGHSVQWRGAALFNPFIYFCFTFLFIYLSFTFPFVLAL